MSKNYKYNLKLWNYTGIKRFSGKSEQVLLRSCVHYTI